MSNLPSFDTRTSFLEKDGSVTRSKVKWFEIAQTKISAAPQIITPIPASSAAKGVKGQVVYDGLDKYEHNGTQWIKFTGTTF